MSHLALRRVMVRLLHDPSLVARLYRNPDAALAGVDLRGEERRWLLDTPREAWGSDAERPQRVLAALLDEFPAAAHLVPRRMRTFFASEPFHRAVQERGSLAAAFGQHLAGEPGARDVARVEEAIARVRRAPRGERASGAGRLRLGAHAAVLEVATGTADSLPALRAGRVPPRAGSGREHLLVLRTPGADDVALEALPDGLAAVLAAAAAGPTAVAALAAVAREHGAEPGEDVAVLETLVVDGLLL